ncbi:MAG TPA: hypothetical protein VH640_02515 [Bryobacteraceae bacterium]|jgi:hypothetical protein
MTHLTEEDLILHYYGEAVDGGTAQVHLDACPDCRAALGSLARVLNAMDVLPVPERPADYETRVWQRLVGTGLGSAPELPFWRRRFIRWPALGLALASALIAVVVIARPPAKPPVRQARTAVVPPEQILRLALGDYLDRSGIVLTELANAPDGRTVDISPEQERAAGLLSECRLYRQTAMRADDQVVAGVLDELERILLEVAHAPSRLEPAEADELRDRLRSEGVLFRIRVLSTTVRNQS